MGVFKGFLFVLWVFPFHFVWVPGTVFSIYSQMNFVMFQTFTDVKWRKGTEKGKIFTK